MKSGQNVGPFEINGFNFHHATRRDAYDDSNNQVSNLHSSKGGGVAVYINDTRPLPEYNIEGICVKCISEDIIVLTVYRPNILCVSQFLLQLEKVDRNVSSLFVLEISMKMQDLRDQFRLL